MGAFYGTKILNKEINTKTNKPWVLEDVPKLWRKKTEQWLDNNDPKK